MGEKVVVVVVVVENEGKEEEVVFQYHLVYFQTSRISILDEGETEVRLL